MPKLGGSSTPLPDGVEVFTAAGAGNYQYSGARPDQLTATEYTLATIIVDSTTSVLGFEAQLVKAIQTAVEACKKSPRADNLLVRVVEFNSAIGIQEIHGFLPLDQIKTSDYKISVHGSTNLFDATLAGVSALISYAKTLAAQDFIVNGIAFVITDGEDNQSRFGPKDVKAALDGATSSEQLESLLTVLIGVNATNCKASLERFHQTAGLTQFVDVGDATAGKLAKLASFVSKSISSQSQSLGSGAPSQNLKF